MGKTTLDRLDAELTQLKATQTNLVDPGDAAWRRQVAATRRVQLEASLKREVDAIEREQGNAARVQQRLAVLARSANTDNARLEHERKWLGEELRKALEKIDVLKARAKANAAAARPAIRWCQRVEDGMTETDATQLQELEAAGTARTQLVEVAQQEAVTFDSAGQE